MIKTHKLHSFGLRDYCEHTASCHNVADTMAFSGVFSENGIAVCGSCAKYYIRRGYNVLITWLLYRDGKIVATSYHTKGLLAYFQQGDVIKRNPHI